MSAPISQSNWRILSEKVQNRAEREGGKDKTTGMRTNDYNSTYTLINLYMHLPL